ALRPPAILVDVARLTRKSVELLRASGTRTVIGLAAEPTPLVPAVVFPHEDAGAAAARHLLDTGRVRPAAVVPREPGIDLMGERRLAGVRSVFPGAERVDLAFSEEEAAAFAARPDLPDGVFAYNDEYALLLISALQDAGIRVPEDVAVVGADDLPLASLVRPRLTSVRFDATASPAELVALIDAMVRGEREVADGAVMTLFTPRLVVRQSA
ncbi:MAG: LacI family DNA-binding transcriptional regulator, partial [Nonomuraea sp.]|nr:LacI family DNA-binding transcriptional regulator [Nonomuraea sp.]